MQQGAALDSLTKVRQCMTSTVVIAHLKAAMFTNVQHSHAILHISDSGGGQIEIDARMQISYVI